MNLLFYKDLNGRPRLRRFAAAALGILCILAGMAWLVRTQPSPVSAIAERVHTGPVVPPKTAPLVTQAPEPSPTPFVCPEDPSAWAFTPIFPDDNYRRIEPACVYDGVARTAAWMLLERMGYSKPEAAELLEFDAVPWAPVRTFYGFTNLKGPLDLALLAEWPAHPGFRFWQVDGEGRPALALSLRGCYTAPGEAGSIVCVVALDRSPGAAVSVLGDLAIAHHGLHLPGARTFHLLDYAGGGRWVLLGQLDGLSLEIEDLAQMEPERLRVTGRLGTIPWDPAWLFAQENLAMNPLPADWRTFGMDAAVVQAIGEALNLFIPPSLQVSDE